MADEPFETPTETSADDWLGEYAEPLAAKGFESPTDLAKAYVELEKAASSKVKMPDMDNPESVAKFFDKLGRPESPDKYEMPKQDDVPIDATIAGVLREAAHKGGITSNQWNGLMGSYLGALKEAQEKQTQELEKLNAERWTNFKVAWGETGTKENIELAKRAIRQSPELEGIISENDVEKDPIFVAVMSRIMRKTLDDTLIPGEGQLDDKNWEPQYKNSPGMYKDGDSPDDKRARAWFEARGHKY